MSLRSRLNSYLQKGRESACPYLDKGKKHGHNMLPVPYSLSGTLGQFLLPKVLEYQLQGAGNKQRLTNAVFRLQQQLCSIYGVQLECLAAVHQPQLLICVEQDCDYYPAVDVDESYRLLVFDNGITINARTEFGALRALQSLLQMVNVDGAEATIANSVIRDQPALKWRGLLLDICRHFMPFELVLKLLDAMAMVKLNVLHLHLTDDQGFRIESQRFPRLQEIDPKAEFYTQEQVRRLVDYAADLGIRVVPELGFPGHCSAVQFAYPELSLAGYNPQAATDFQGDFSPPLDITKAATYDFIAQLAEEITGLFPDQYIHLGGDEVPGQSWLQDAATEKYMTANGLRTAAALQAAFTRRYVNIIKSFGKRPVVWEEAINDSLPESVTVQPWESGSYQFDTSKHPIINSWGFYLDFKRPAWSHYRQNPTAIQVNGAQVDPAAVLGAEMAMWTESVTPETLMRTVWPRAMAMAESFWCGHKVTSRIAITDLYRRMDAIGQLMEAGALINRDDWRDDIRQLAGKADNSLETLAEVIEPAGYHHLRKRNRIPELLLPSVFPGSFHDSDGSLFLEKLPPESMAAYHFRVAVEQYLSGDGSQFQSLEQQLQRWQDNHASASAIINNQPRLKSEGLGLVSARLSRIAGIGLELLQAMEQGRPVSRLKMASFQRVLDGCEYDLFFMGNYREHRSFIMGFLKPDPLNRHNLAIQPGIRQLLEACR